MRTIKKAISLLLVLAMLGAFICSCDLVAKDPVELVSEADLVLQEKAYTMNMVIKYESEDEGMKAAIDSFSNPTIKTEVSGDAFRISMTFDKEGTKNGVTYTYVDSVLYTELSDFEFGVKKTETVEDFDSSDRDELLEALGAGATISIDDFETLSTKSRGDVSVITCTDIKDEPLSKLVSVLDERLAYLDAVVAIKNVTLAIQINDGAYEATVLTCEYVITTPDAVYTLNMTYAAKFTYGDVNEITAPEI